MRMRSLRVGSDSVRHAGSALPVYSSGKAYWEPDSIGASRVLRGGSWYFRGYHCRSANRNRNNPAYRFDTFGVRVVAFPSPGR